MDALVKQCEAAGEAVKQAKAGGDADDVKAKVEPALPRLFSPSKFQVLQ